MRRNMSSRLLFSADDDSLCSFSDVENPPHRPQTRRQQRSRLFSLPRSPLRTLPMLSSALLSLTSQRYILLPPAMWRSVFLSLVSIFVCSLIYSLRNMLPNALAAVAIFLVAYFFFKTTSRTDLWLSHSRECSIFLDINEPSPAKKSRINGLSVELLHGDIVYAGEFKNGVRTGRGLVEIPGKCTYGGEWVEGGSEGHGVENIVGHGVYKGQFFRGMRTGYGHMQFSNGDEYTGQWSNGERDGMGRQTCVNGSFYEGQFNQGLKHGLGTYHYSNGDVYQGQFFNDKCIGVGIYIFSFGDRYEGSWHDNQMEGYGVYIQRDDQIRPGKWVKGVLTVSLPISDPHVERAVQAAREAAQNCTELGEIEDQVFKAITDATNSYKAAQAVSTVAHSIKKLHPLHPRRLVATASAKSCQALRRTLQNFGRSTANLARLMADLL